MRFKVLGIFLGFSMLALGTPVFGHHAFEAEFDLHKSIKLTGVLTKVEWVNPHVYFYMDVKDASGNITTWQFENSPPGILRRGGLERNMLPLNQTITVEGYGAKDGSKNLGWINTMHLADGSTITLMSPSQQAKANQ
jgi:hypothetical protein